MGHRALLAKRSLKLRGGTPSAGTEIRRKPLPDVRKVGYSNARYFDIVGLTVQQVTRSLRDLFNIPQNATAWVNGQAVAPSYALQDDDTLEFSRRFGVKGGLHDFWSEKELVELFGHEKFEAMREAGLNFTTQPVLSADEVSSWMKWLADQSQKPRKSPNIIVDVEKEEVTYHGKTYPLDRTLALILKCLLDAHGEIRSTTDIVKAFPDEPWEERLDLTIRRRLLKHPSGIGELIESVPKKGYRIRE